MCVHACVYVCVLYREALTKNVAAVSELIKLCRGMKHLKVGVVYTYIVSESVCVCRWVGEYRLVSM